MYRSVLAQCMYFSPGLQHLQEFLSLVMELQIFPAVKHYPILLMKEDLAGFTFHTNFWSNATHDMV